MTDRHVARLGPRCRCHIHRLLELLLLLAAAKHNVSLPLLTRHSPTLFTLLLLLRKTSATRLSRVCAQRESVEETCATWSPGESDQMFHC